MAPQSVKECIRTLARRHAELGAGKLYSIFQAEASRDLALGADSMIGFSKFKRVLREVREESVEEPVMQAETDISSTFASAGEMQPLSDVKDDSAPVSLSSESSEARQLVKSFANQLDEMRRSNADVSPEFAQKQARSQAQRHARESASEWAYNWSYSSGGTTEPIARAGYSNLVFKELQVPCDTVQCNESDNADLSTLERALLPSTATSARDIDIANLASIQYLMHLGWEFEWEKHDTSPWEDLFFQPVHLLEDTQPFSLRKYDILKKSHECLKGVFLLRQRTVMQVSFADFLKIYMPGYAITDVMQRQKHDFHGPLVHMQSDSAYGFAALKDLADSTPSSLVAFIPHLSEILHTDGNIVLSAVTGRGPQTVTKKRSGKRRNRRDEKHKRLHESDVSTYFSLRSSNDELARCLMSWNNTDCAELGPNIEMLAVRQCKRGQGWLHKFYRAIEHFALQRWTMTGRTEDGKRRCRIFAAYLTGTEVETRTAANGRSASISDKDFFLKFEGFEARFDAMNCIGGVLLDEDAVKYIRPKDVDGEQSAFDDSDACMTKDSQESRLELCQYCACSSKETHLFKCSLCKQVKYCSTSCQKADWPQHKLWCQKTKDDFEDD
eukprot:TRINITY_DN25756_c0_g1_i1.p1 TRINITY_DN25756_c0_g1~~TRINITY_DN25756_c0_g1_i1.p1  ORF type:complete len:613 (-),score=70.89 TRINITY_DN25756_c0_g1_i1:23-1861(-)